MLAIRILIVLCVLLTAGAVYMNASAPEDALANDAGMPEERMITTLDENGVEVRQTVQVFDLSKPPVERPESGVGVFMKTITAIFKGDNEALFPADKAAQNGEAALENRTGNGTRVARLPAKDRTKRKVLMAPATEAGTQPRDFTKRN